MLERTLDDSASRRVLLPEAFLCADEMLLTVTRLVKGLKVDTIATAVNLAEYGSFAATEQLLMAAVAAGADRQAMHEVIRQHSMDAWTRLPGDRTEALAQGLEVDGRVTRWIRRERVRPLLDATGYIGDAPERAMRLAAAIRLALAETR
jgi:adenylosuccinate lyase